MKQVKFYKYTTIFLMILNLLMVAFFLITKPKKGHVNKKNAIEILNLDKTQHEAFLEYVDKHKGLMQGFDKEQKQLLKITRS